MPNKLIAIYFGPTANLLMIDFKFLRSFVSGRTWDCKRQSFPTWWIGFFFKEKKKKEKRGKRFKSKVFIVAFCWQTTDIQWEISMQKKRKKRKEMLTLPLKFICFWNSQQIIKVDILLMVAWGKDLLPYEVNCNCTINLQRLRFLINQIDAHCPTGMGYLN